MAESKASPSEAITKAIASFGFCVDGVVWIMALPRLGGRKVRTIKGKNMDDPSKHDNSKAPRQATNKGEPEDAKAAYYAKQDQDIKESVEKYNRQLNKTKEPSEEGGKKDASPKSAPAPESETQGEDNDYYNGMSQ